MKNNALFSAGNLESFIFVSTPWPHSIPSKRLKGWKLQGERHSRKQITNCFTCKQPCWDHAASPESEQADTIPPRDELFWSSSRLEHEEHRSQQMFKPYSPSPPSSKGIFLFCFFFFSIGFTFQNATTLSYELQTRLQRDHSSQYSEVRRV